MQAENEKEQTIQKPRASSTARIALCSAVFVLFASPILTIIVKIHRSNGEENTAMFIIGTIIVLSIVFGSLAAIATVLITFLSLPFIEAKAKSFIMAVGAVLLLLPAAFILPPLGTVGPRARRVVCATNLKGLGTSFVVYANEYNDELPTFENWCDLLISKVDIHPYSLMCSATDVFEGESSYALNKNVTGMKLSEIPEDVILMFETNISQYETERNIPIISRKYFKDNPDYFEDYDESLKVLEKRWNQVGGPETLTTENHQGRGCNILFADGHAEFVKTEDIPNLRWKP
jgi:prepilin-type processing-associated H-X9-DG protein